MSEGHLLHTQKTFKTNVFLPNPVKANIQHGLSHRLFCLDMTTVEMETMIISSKYIKDYLCKYLNLRC